ncbi:MAG: hypothetical protein ABIO86_08840 [Sphingomonas sp.]
MTKLSNMNARFSAISPRGHAFGRRNPRRIMSHFQHIRRALAPAIQPVPEIGDIDVADRQKAGASSSAEALM